MKEERFVQDYIVDILSAISDIEEFIAGITFEEFLADKKTHLAVIHSIEIIGEATRKIPESFRLKYPAIPWKDMAGMRDKLIHDYIGVDLRIVWETATQDILLLKEKLRSLD